MPGLQAPPVPSSPPRLQRSRSDSLCQAPSYLSMTISRTPPNPEAAQTADHTNAQAQASSRYAGPLFAFARRKPHAVQGGTHSGRRPAPRNHHPHPRQNRSPRPSKSLPLGPRQNDRSTQAHPRSLTSKAKAQGGVRVRPQVRGGIKTSASFVSQEALAIFAPSPKLGRGRRHTIVPLFCSYWGADACEA